MNNNLVVLPILLPLVAGILLMFFKDNVKLQRVVSGAVSLAGLALAFYLGHVVVTDGIQIMMASNWVPPFGIVLVADVFSILMLIIAALVGAACMFFSFYTIDEGRERHYYYPFYHLLMVGVNGSFLTGDIFNLFVFFEIMLLSSYALIVLGGEKPQLRETVKYVVINMIASVMFLVGVALLYSVTGTLNMADLAVKVPHVENQGMVTVIALVFLMVFGIKGALFPLYFWMPRSYQPPPSAVSALFGGLLTKVGVYCLIRVFTLIFITDVAFTHTIIIYVASATMFFGVLGAISQMDIKAILSFHIISQVGYMILGLGIFTVLGVAGAIFYTINNIVVKCCLFLCGGVTEKITGKTDLSKMGGLLKAFPVVGWLFFVSGLAQAGVPPLSGFFTKFAIIQSGLLEGHYFAVGVSLLVGLLTLFSMMKIFIYAFWGEEKGHPTQPVSYWKTVPPVLALVAAFTFMGFQAEWVMSYCLMAAEQLMNPEIYINAVLMMKE